jgi:putative CocE/NonD family hydrolase
VRSPYGRGGLIGLLYGRLIAERGFQVVVQSVRGTFGSDGRFDPFGTEREDGLATVDWLRRQPWYPGSFGTVGASYLGFTQWAIARDAGPDLKAMALQVTASQFRDQTYAGGAYSLDATLSWTHLTVNQEHRLDRVVRLLGSTRRLRPLFARLPLKDLDRLATGAHVPYYQAWLAHDAPGDAYWSTRGFDATVAEVTAPVTMVGGWYDIFLPWQLEDYAALRAAGREPQLTIGPWAHGDLALMAAGARESLAWCRAHLRGERDALRAAPVRVFVTGAGEWRDLPAWPPAGARRQRWHLQPGGGLAPPAPPPSEPDRYTYDPADPTPALAGPLLFGKARPTDNRPLEARADVRTYTSAPLDRDVEVAGAAVADLIVRSSRAHTDFFARLCDVEPSGRSVNVCDALLRLAPGRPEPAPDGTVHARIELWPTAHRFRRGHRIRLQVSSGAHPRYARNPGGGEPLGTATTLLSAEQQVHHDPEHPSAVLLPVLG